MVTFVSCGVGCMWSRRFGLHLASTPSDACGRGLLPRDDEGAGVPGRALLAALDSTSKGGVSAPSEIRYIPELGSMLITNVCVQGGKYFRSMGSGQVTVQSSRYSTQDFSDELC